MSGTRVFKCYNCDQVFKVEGYLTACPLCGRMQGFLEGNLRDRESVDSGSVPANSRQREFELIR